MSKCPNGVFREKESCGNAQNCDPKKCMDMLERVVTGNWFT